MLLVSGRDIFHREELSFIDVHPTIKYTPIGRTIIENVGLKVLSSRFCSLASITTLLDTPSSRARVISSRFIFSWPCRAPYVVFLLKVHTLCTNLINLGLVLTMFAFKRGVGFQRCLKGTCHLGQVLFQLGDLLNRCCIEFLIHQSREHQNSPLYLNAG